MDPLLTAIVRAVSEIGSLGVAGLVIWALLTERIVPRGRLEDMRKDRDAAMRDRDEAEAERRAWPDEDPNDPHWTRRRKR